MSNADHKSRSDEPKPDQQVPARVPKKDKAALSNALRANLQRRKRALKAQKQHSGAPDGGPAAEDEAKWTR
jgi:hypothetical protein